MENDVRKQKPETPDSQLIELILKYRDAVNHHEYLPVSQRESDREDLNALYRKLRTIRQKILDTKCYLELGKLQKQLSNQFLADDTTPVQRLRMLAYLVRSLSHPILSLSGRLSLLFDAAARTEASTAQIIEDNFGQPQVADAVRFHSYSISGNDIEQIQQEIRSLLTQYPARHKWQKYISLKQAQVLSQMAASGDIEVTARSKAGEPEQAIASIVIKETK